MDSTPQDDFPHLGLRVSYDGKDFSGFQLQADAESVQSQIEKAFRVLFRKSCRIQFTSRTDAGVHSFDQWLILNQGRRIFESKSFEFQKRFLVAINALLPESIRIWEVFFLSKKFHPKKSSQWKEYRYRICQGIICDPLLREQATWLRSPLNLPRIRKAMLALKGSHDFAAFTKTSSLKGEKPKNTRRQLLECRLQVSAHPYISGLRILDFHFKGTGFLRHMIRSIVGTLVEIGRGKDYSISKILKSKDRRLAGPTIGAQGLILLSTRIDAALIKEIPAVRAGLAAMYH